MTFSSWMALAVTLIFWASAFAAIRAGIRDYSPFHFALLRFLTASFGLAVAALMRGIRRPGRGDIPRLALIGLLGVTLYHLALNAGERTVTAGAASFLINMAPLFTVIWASLLLKERLSGRMLAGLAVSFGGAAVIAWGEGAGSWMSPAALLVLGAALCHSGFIVLQKTLLTRYRPLDIACYAVWFGTLFLLPFSHGWLTAVRLASPAATWAGIYLGIFPAALSFVTWAYVLARIPASRAALFLYLIPPIALVIAWFWLNEFPSTLSLVGGLITLFGVAIGSSKS